MRAAKHRGFWVERQRALIEGFTLVAPGRDIRDGLNRLLAFTLRGHSAADDDPLYYRTHIDILLTEYLDELRSYHPIDGVPWHIHAIHDVGARKAAVSAYLKEARLYAQAKTAECLFPPPPLDVPRARLPRSGK